MRVPRRNIKLPIVLKLLTKDQKQIFKKPFDIYVRYLISLGISTETINIIPKLGFVHCSPNTGKWWTLWISYQIYEQFLLCKSSLGCVEMTHSAFFHLLISVENYFIRVGATAGFDIYRMNTSRCISTASILQKHVTPQKKVESVSHFHDSELQDYSTVYSGEQQRGSQNLGLGQGKRCNFKLSKVKLC